MSDAQGMQLNGNVTGIRSKTNIVLWIAQILLAMMFLMAGFMKTFQPFDVLAGSMQWTQSIPPLFVRFIGISELTGGIGLIVPAVTGIRPHLTVLAALGLALTMASASIFHIARGEFFALPINVFLLALATIVTYGRWKLEPLSSRK